MRAMLVALCCLFWLPSVAVAQTDSQIRQLLLSSPWCSFSYNKVSGTTRTERVLFGSDGTMVVGSGAETYSSGPSGSVAGQGSSGGRYFWKVESGDLHLSEDRMTWQPVGLDGKRNSNGAIILIADGKEYAQCN